MASCWTLECSIFGSEQRDLVEQAIRPCALEMSGSDAEEFVETYASDDRDCATSSATRSPWIRSSCGPEGYPHRRVEEIIRIVVHE
jgi:hypothetical protein